MDLWGAGWLVLAFVLFPFGYKPIVALMSISAIFQASKIITLAGVNLPLFFCMELITILRLSIPYKNNNFLSLKTKKFFYIFVFILLIYLQTFFSTSLFNGIKVYSAENSFEDNYMLGGDFLRFTSSNINQLVLITVNLILMYCLYVRGSYLSKEFYLKTIFYSFFIFFIVSIIWYLYKDLYLILSNFLLNNDNYSITSIYENRLSATFSEPSFAGLFIGSLFLPTLLYRNNKKVLIFLCLCFLSLLNMSGTLIFSALISFILFFLFITKNNMYRLIFVILSFLFGILIYFIVFNLLDTYIFEKKSSISGIVRYDSNLFAINNLIQSYFVGVGVGSLRVSSLIINLFASFGIFLTIVLLFLIHNFIRFKGSNSDKVSLFMLLVCFVGSWSSIPDYSLAILWNLIFLNVIPSGEDCKNN